MFAFRTLAAVVTLALFYGAGEDANASGNGVNDPNTV